MALTASQIKANPEEAEHYIEQLLAENEKMRVALDKCADIFGDIKSDFTDPREDCRRGIEIACAALGQR